MKNNLAKIIVLSLMALISANCGGKSDVTGEVMPIERVCRYEKWKTVAVEGYLAPETMRLRKVERQTGARRNSRLHFHGLREQQRNRRERSSENSYDRLA